MKLSALAVLGFVQLNLGATIQYGTRNDVAYDRRFMIGSQDGAPTVIKSLKTVTDATAGLDMTINGINSPDLTQLLALNTGSQQLTTILQQQTAVVQGAPDVGLLSALGVQIAAMKLIDEVKKTLKDLEKKQPFIAQAGVCPLVVQALQQQKAAGDGYSAALTSKVPSLVQFIATADGNAIDKAFDEAIMVYSSCPAPTSSSPPPASTVDT